MTYNQNRQRLDLQFFEFGKGYVRAGGNGGAFAKTDNDAPEQRPAPTEYEQLAIWTAGARQPEHYGTDAARRTGYAHVRGLAEGVLRAIGLPAEGEGPIGESSAKPAFAYAHALHIGGKPVAIVGRIARVRAAITAS